MAAPLSTERPSPTLLHPDARPLPCSCRGRAHPLPGARPISPWPNAPPARVQHPLLLCLCSSPWPWFSLLAQSYAQEHAMAESTPLHGRPSSLVLLEQGATTPWHFLPPSLLSKFQSHIGMQWCLSSSSLSAQQPPPCNPWSTPTAAFPCSPALRMLCRCSTKCL
jgi:hypothetical protein